MNGKLLINWKANRSKIEKEAIEIRRLLHQYPELSFKEYKTSAFIKGYCSKLPNTEVISPTETSVLVKITGTKPGLKIGFRADIDALPVQEENDVSYKSKIDGVMHACGHDGHTAMLLAATKFMAHNAQYLTGEIYSIFQHAEESFPGGASEMVETGLFDDFDFIYGHHIASLAPLNKIQIRDGNFYANSDRYIVKVKGAGGHASTPHKSVDPVIVATEIISAYQNLVSRFNDPLEPVVVSNTYMSAGNPNSLNVIPAFAEIGGSVRTASLKNRAYIKKRLKEIADGICSTYGAKCKFDFVDGYTTIINNPVTTDYTRDLVEKLYPGQSYQGSNKMGGEDFSAFALRNPATYINLGAGLDDGVNRSHHSSTFDFDERVLIKGIEIFVSIAAGFTNTMGDVDLYREAVGRVKKGKAYDPVK